MPLKYPTEIPNWPAAEEFQQPCLQWHLSLRVKQWALRQGDVDWCPLTVAASPSQECFVLQRAADQNGPATSSSSKTGDMLRMLTRPIATWPATPPGTGVSEEKELTERSSDPNPHSQCLAGLNKHNTLNEEVLPNSNLESFQHTISCSRLNGSWFHHIQNPLETGITEVRLRW